MTTVTVTTDHPATLELHKEVGKGNGLDGCSWAPATQPLEPTNIYNLVFTRDANGSTSHQLEVDDSAHLSFGNSEPRTPTPQSVSIRTNIDPRSWYDALAVVVGSK